jgi:CDGSH-type Zn-finger protein
MTKPVISCSKNGPMIIKGLENLIDSDGQRLETKAAMGLCRCGASKNKPWCDGTHKDIGFSDEPSADRTEDKATRYEGREVTIVNNPLLCSVAEYCHRELESVFNMHNDPWINPDGGTLENIKAVIEKCPSGALSYSINGQPQPVSDCDATVTIEKNGPLRITGGIELKDVNWGQGASQEHYTLCRCGASRNKPFCDGSHLAINFDDSQ